MGKRIKGNTGKARAAKRVTQEPQPEGTDAQKFLVWRFGRLDHESRFGCQTLLRDDARELEAELAILQTETIDSLLRKRWLKFIRADEMTPDGQKALATVSRKQEEGLWQLHLKRYKWRIWGYFDKPEFFFLWWDSDHGVATGKWRHRRD